MLNKMPFKTHPFLAPAYLSLMKLPTPSSISFFWNFGSLSGLTLIMQILTGLILTFFFVPNADLAFSSVFMMTRNINLSWLIQWMHVNGASLFFLFIYLHISRNLFFMIFKNKMVFSIGIILLFTLMGTAFLGYVLPWGQMSFWGASVITNLLSAIPYIGPDSTIWLWGGFSVNNPTLKRFFSLHFILPFILMILTLMHLIALHTTGSSNPIMLKNSIDMISFHSYFTLKDLMGLIFTTTLFMFSILQYPLIFGDPENFNPSNPLVTPIHIQPEWYFLFAYAILRSIPNKLLGVIALLLSICVLFIPMLKSFPTNSMKFDPMKKFLTSLFLSSFIVLTWIGANPVEYPFVTIGQLFSILYFISFLMIF